MMISANISKDFPNYFEQSLLLEKIEKLDNFVVEVRIENIKKPAQYEIH